MSDVDYLSDLPSSLRVYRWELRLAWAHVSRLLSWVARNARDALGRNESPGGGRQTGFGLRRTLGCCLTALNIHSSAWTARGHSGGEELVRLMNSFLRLGSRGNVSELLE